MEAYVSLILLMNQFHISFLKSRRIMGKDDWKFIVVFAGRNDSIIQYFDGSSCS